MTGTIIRSYQSKEAKEEPSLISALELHKLAAPIISVVGGGGKTSVIRCLAEEYEKKGQPVIVTTTTKMKLPNTDLFLSQPDMERLAEMIKEHRAVWMGSRQEAGKMGPLPMAFLEAVRLLQVPILIEADGANRLPFKAPAEHEPVIWSKSTEVIGVVGLDAVGMPIKEVCHRPEQVEALLGRSMEKRLRCEDIVKIALSTEGLKKATDPYMKHHIILNKADDEKRLMGGEQIVALFGEKGYKNVLITANLKSDYAVVVLAAGRGSRFGGNKLLYEIDGRPMYEHMLDALKACKNMTCVIVTGYQEIIEKALDAGIHVAYNFEPELGISHSLTLGVLEAKKQNPELDGIVFAVCDQPNLTAESICKMMYAAKGHRGKIVCASEHGKPRNPVLWDKIYLDELCNLSGDVGGRQLMEKYRERIEYVEIDEKELKDIDQKEDLSGYLNTD